MDKTSCTSTLCLVSINKDYFNSLVTSVLSFGETDQQFRLRIPPRGVLQV